LDYPLDLILMTPRPTIFRQISDIGTVARSFSSLVSKPKYN